jgi:hypothetical protein
VIDRKSTKRIVIGLFLFISPILALTIFPRLLGQAGLLFLLLSWLGILVTIDGVWILQGHDSILSVKQRTRLLKLAAVSIVFGLLLEVFGAYFTRLWFYPEASLLLYCLLAAPAFISYGIILLFLYEFFDKHSTRRLKNSFSYKTLMEVELLAGMTLFGYSALSLYNSFQRLPVEVWRIDKGAQIDVSWWLPFCAMISLFFIFEYLSYRYGEKTLTEDLLLGNMRPILAILVASIVAILLIEYVNVPFDVWEFTNWPLQNTSIYGMPVFALLAWPFQFLALLSMVRFALKPSELKIW